MEIFYVFFNSLFFIIGYAIRSKQKNKNMSKQYLFTNESVSEGHPDKVCDIISD